MSKTATGHLKHSVKHGGCGGVAFVTDGVLGDPMTAENIWWPDGTTFKTADPYICFTCKEHIHPGSLIYFGEVEQLD